MNKAVEKIKKKAFLVLLSAIVISILLAGLWPFDFLPENGAALKNGLEFKGRGVAYSYGPRMLPDRAFTLELSIIPYEEPANKESDLLSFYTDGWDPVLKISQWKGSIIIAGEDRRWIDRALSKGHTFFITVTFEEGKASLYVSGVHARNFTLRVPEQGKARWLVLGSSPEGRRNWQGRIRSLVIKSGGMSQREVIHDYACSLENNCMERDAFEAYLFREDGGELAAGSAGGRIMVPRQFNVLRKQVLSVPLMTNRFDIRDAVINFLGFMPFGMAACAALGANRRRAALTIFSGLLLSLFIELAQVYIPERYSSASDLVLNTAGTVFGTALYLLFLRLRTPLV